MKRFFSTLSVLGFLVVGASATVKESVPVGIIGVEVSKDASKVYLTIYPSTSIDGYTSFVTDETTSTGDVSDFLKLMQSQALTAKSIGSQNVSIRYDGQVLKGIKILN